MRVDAHHHVWDLAVRDQPWTSELPRLRRSFDFADLAPCLRANRIDATVLVQTITVAEETPEFLQLAEDTAEIAGVVGWVDLTAPDVADRLHELRAGPGGKWLVGIRHQVQGEPDDKWLCRAEVRRGLAAVAAAGLVFDLLVTSSQLPAAIDTARALPELSFVLDHAGKPPIALGETEPWRGDLSELATLPNVAVKLSGLVTEARPDWTTDDLLPYAEHALSSFGPDRVMFGSDWPVCLLAATYDEVLTVTEELTAQLSEDERAEVFGGTAVRWYGLGA
ncbi:L-fuconolactonase [Actinokineospora alba]|uniref:L-fuconolactonase n=1 Tax=Actinokineospora alba TaxID=504798 RepID=A0A1H0FE93_9PSEU|nr:amidohydrolase family protein [Actinokineospora alba]TDP69444.1 L-fuconolactonase [Actinokineospora alba]SDI16677.1 L-fuconolactonase [Actinokineospora alba]SDN92930.1 L-fuconolactonase [Actinokineospora alba]